MPQVFAQQVASHQPEVNPNQVLIFGLAQQPGGVQPGVAMAQQPGVAVAQPMPTSHTLAVQVPQGMQGLTPNPNPNPNPSPSPGPKPKPKPKPNPNQVPQGMQGGMSMQVQTPSGVMQVQVPPDLQPGMTFQIEVPKQQSNPRRKPHAHPHPGPYLHPNPNPDQVPGAGPVLTQPAVAVAMPTAVAALPAVPQTPVPADPLEAMRNLKAMLDGGMIDQNEYEAKKSELMARM